MNNAFWNKYGAAIYGGSLIGAMALIMTLSSCSEKKLDCMRMYYGGLDIELCSADVTCHTSEDESGSVKICRMKDKEEVK